MYLVTWGVLARPDTRVGWMRPFSRAARARSGDAEPHVRRAHARERSVANVAYARTRRERPDTCMVALAAATADGTARSGGGRRYGRARPRSARANVRTCETRPDDQRDYPK